MSFHRLCGALIIVVSPLAAEDKPMTFPGAEWEVAKPGAEGLDDDRLQAAITFLSKHVGRDGVSELVVVRRGRLVWQGENAANIHGVWSCTKSFTSTLLGLLIADGKCSLESKAARLSPPLEDKYSGVTLRHFATMTSGYRAAGDAEATGSYLHGPSSRPFEPADELFPPGQKFAYWDSAMNMFGLCLTAAAGEPLETMLKQRIMDPIGIDAADWSWGDCGEVALPGGKIKVNNGSGNADGHIRISARALARFGHLLLNEGRWQSRQLVPAAWIKEATKVQVPAEVPDGFSRSDIPGSGMYGYNWWVNGRKADGALRWPDAPARTFAANGHNNNRLWVVPKWALVLVRLGLDEGDRRLTADFENEFLRQIGRSLRD